MNRIAEVHVARDPTALAYPFAPAHRLDIDPRYAELRKQGLTRIQLPYGEPGWLATSVADALIAYDHRKFSRAEGLRHTIPGLRPNEHIKIPHIMLNMDPPEHTRLRRLAGPAFSPQRAHEMRGWVTEIADGLIDDMERAGPPCDFVGHFSSRLPVYALARVLGIPRDMAMAFKDLTELSSSATAPLPEKRAAHARVEAFIMAMVEERRRAPRDDLMSQLVNAREGSDRYTDDELNHLALGLWHGGFKTTLWQLGTTLYTLLSQRDLWLELCGNPSLVPAAITELLRWIPGTRYGMPFPTWAKEDVEFTHGKIVRKGEPVLVEFSVCNRDPEVWDNPDMIDFHRVKPAQHLAFTAGPHQCAGQHVARLELAVSIERLVARLPDLELAVSPDEIEFQDDTMLRSVRALPVRW